MCEPIRIGLIGCGGIAQSHLNALSQLPEFEVLATCDVDRARAQAAADQHGARLVFTDYNEMLATEELNAVSICLPHHLHRDERGLPESGERVRGLRREFRIVEVAAQQAGPAFAAEGPLSYGKDAVWRCRTGST